jgi:hypothetical protein
MIRSTVVSCPMDLDPFGPVRLSRGGCLHETYQKLQDLTASLQSGAPRVGV